MRTDGMDFNALTMPMQVGKSYWLQGVGAKDIPSANDFNGLATASATWRHGCILVIMVQDTVMLHG